MSDTERRLIHLYDALAEWSDATFGTPEQRGPVGALRHLADEAIEAADAPDDIVERADCLMLLLDANRRAGSTIDELIDAAFCKLVANKGRDYSVVAANGVITHRKDSTP